MRMSDEIDQIAAALVKAQAALQPVKRDKTNPHFKSKYADLSSIIDAIDEALNSNGIAYIQHPVSNIPGAGEQVCVGIATMLLHTSGQWIQQEFILPIPKQDPQNACAAVTYARRYGLKSMVGLPEEDDDGNKASERPSTVATRTTTVATKAASDNAIAAMSISAKAQQMGIDWPYLAKLIEDVTGVKVTTPQDAAKKLSSQNRAKVLAFLNGQGTSTIGIKVPDGADL